MKTDGDSPTENAELREANANLEAISGRAIKERDALCDALTKLEARLAEVTEERDDLQALFDLSYDANQRAIRRWQEAHKKPLIWPDHANMVVWMLGEMERLEGAIATISATSRKWSDTPSPENALPRMPETEEEVAAAEAMIGDVELPEALKHPPEVYTTQRPGIADDNAVESHHRDDWFADVFSFHKKFGCHIGTVPFPPDRSTTELRIKLVREELEELGLGIHHAHLPDIADACIDLIYEILGLCVSYGIDPRPLWREHAANMRKVGGAVREDGKVLKPAGGVAPDIAGLLDRQASLAVESPPPACESCGGDGNLGISLDGPTFTCAGCGHRLQLSGPMTSDNLNDTAMVMGWEKVGEKWFCGPCSEPLKRAVVNAISLLEQSAKPFDDACMVLRNAINSPPPASPSSAGTIRTGTTPVPSPTQQKITEAIRQGKGEYPPPSTPNGSGSSGTEERGEGK